MKKDELKKWTIILIGMLYLYGCATSGDVQVLDKDIQRLDFQMNQIQKEKDLTKKEIEALRAELPAIKKEIESNHSSLQAENQRIRADLSIRLETLQSELRILSTGVEEYKEFMKTPSKEISRVREDFEVRLRILEEKGKASDEKNRLMEEKNRLIVEQIKDLIKEMEGRFKGLDAKWSSKLADLEKSILAKELPAEPKPPSTTAGNLYKDAYETFQRGDLEGGRRKFEAFLKQYPNMELSDNAQFWIGETYFVKKDFEKAILEYEKVIVKYPEGDKVSSALLKQGLAFLELGDKTNARALLKRVMDRFPQTEQADIAKKKLETIK